jgi:2-methylaconitate cis-trans-isomerase PrpF
LTTLAAQLVQLYAEREPVKAELEALEDEIDRLETLAHTAMVQAGMTAFSTEHASINLRPRIVFNATDWAALQAHIVATGEFDILKRALSLTALRERGEALPPGVARVTLEQFVFKPTTKGI